MIMSQDWLQQAQAPVATHAADAIDYEQVFLIAPIGLAILDAGLRYVRCNEVLAGINGIPAADHIGRTLRELLPQLAGVVEQRFLEVIRSGIPTSGIKVVGETPRSPGITRTWLESIQPLSKHGGSCDHILVSVQEITPLEEAEAALHRSERLLNVSQQLSPDGFVIMRAIRKPGGEVVDFAFEYANPAAERFIGRGRAAGRSLLEMLPKSRSHPQLFERFARLLSSSDADEVEIVQERSGRTKWFRNSVVAIGSDHVAVAIRDISKRKRAEEELELVTGEYRHRVKNVIAVLTAIVRGTATDMEDAQSFSEALQKRLRIMAAAQDLISAPADNPVSLEAACQAALAPFNLPGLQLIAGPKVRIKRDAVVLLILALNELATNAIKHGPLSSGGTASLSWWVAEGRVTLNWRECGGAYPSHVPEEGFGSKLIASSVRALPDGRLDREMKEDGLTIGISFAAG